MLSRERLGVVAGLVLYNGAGPLGAGPNGGGLGFQGDLTEKHMKTHPKRRTRLERRMERVTCSGCSMRITSPLQRWMRSPVRMPSKNAMSCW